MIWDPTETNYDPHYKVSLLGLLHSQQTGKNTDGEASKKGSHHSNLTPLPDSIGSLPLRVSDWGCKGECEGSLRYALDLDSA